MPQLPGYDVKERKILDAIEDANAELESRKLRIRAWSYLGSLLGFVLGVSIVLANLLGNEHWYLLTVAIAIALFIYVVLTCIGVSEDHFTTTKQRKALRIAERAYRDFIISATK